MARSSRRPPRRLILGTLLLAVGLLTFLSLPQLGLGPVTGPFGSFWVAVWSEVFGVPSVAVLATIGMLWGIGLLVRWERRRLVRLLLLSLPFLISGEALRQRIGVPADGGLQPGWLGARLGGGVAAFFGAGGRVQTTIALVALSLATLLLFLRWGLPAPLSERIARALRAVGGGFAWSARGLGAAVAGSARQLGRGVAGMCRGRGAVPGRPPGVPEPAERGAPAEPVAPPRGGSEPEAWAAPVIRQAAPVARPERPVRRRVEDVPPAGEGPAQVPFDLLAVEGAEAAGVGEEEIGRNAALLRETLSSFGIEGSVGEVHPGPVITRYEFTPGVGVTISQITSRQDDLALALRASRIRLLAPIPGKAAVGIEIPNREPALISFGEIVRRREFRQARAPLAIALGKDVGGQPFYTSLEKMPHLLVAGTTGSGKSVCINSMIVSLLLRCTPEQLRLLMIDPKMLELTTYNDIPHLLRPVVTEPREAARALQWLTREMERRYRRLAGLGVRNISAYLERREQGRDDPALEPMPYIVVFVDELADLMMSNQAEIEVPIARLAQMARAVGIHLVLATQRPSVDVLTGVIKANFPARIAFQVASRTDSRTVLDMNGAESLIGRGDMLFIPPGKAQAHRVHGAFLSDEEIERIAAYLRQFPPAPPLIVESEQGEGVQLDEDLDDPLFREALRIVVASQQGSTSMLQRRLRVGYTRAGRLMDLLEREGIVGPPDGSRAREVLVPPSYLQKEGAER